jgi:hypothetical protein
MQEFLAAVIPCPLPRNLPTSVLQKISRYMSDLKVARIIMGTGASLC